MTALLPLFATCPKGLEGLLAQELTSLGATVGKEQPAGVRFTASLAVAYRCCLWSRLANRILFSLTEFEAPSADALYDGLRAIDWTDHFSQHATFVVDFAGTSDAIRNTQFGAQRAKDAVVDAMQARVGSRPSVDLRRPDWRLHVQLHKGRVAAAIDLGGGSLHRRGYRLEGGLAPLKENLAAALLLRADWPGMAARGGALLDPLCGSGTLLIEGALMAMDIAPGILAPRRWGFLNWLGHDDKLWRLTEEEARTRRASAADRQWPEIRGYDASAAAVRAAEENIERAGLTRRIRVLRKELAQLTRPTHTHLPTGLLITNPPYGERLGEQQSLRGLYRHLGERLREEFVGWEAAVFTGNPDLGKTMGLRSHKQYRFWNGTLPSQLLLFHVQPERFVRSAPADEAAGLPAAASDENALSPGATMFANRLRKNLKRLEKWRRQHAVSCFRVYDADMPEYAVAVDCYADWVHVAEYAPPASVDPESAAARLDEVVAAIPAALAVAPERVVVKQRRRQKGTSQYERLSQRGEFIEVQEGAARLLVNLHDYLDTGLFLDHRPVRLKIAELARGKRLLNLFCYTATASVHAGLGGARTTTSVDMSATYLDWARHNLALNGLSEARHHLVQADCLRWLEACRDSFDLILLDPPTFSNSKRMEETFDVQRDHPFLISHAMRLLAPGGLLIFSNNRRRFQLDPALAAEYAEEDVTRWSLDPDFARSTDIHQCWFIRHREARQ